MRIYSIYHIYDVDGGIGDAIPKDKCVATFESETDAKAFVEKYSNPYVYNTPYDELYCNEFQIREIEIVSHAEFDINKTPADYGIWIPEKEVKAK